MTTSPGDFRIRDDVLTAQLAGEAVLLDVQTKRYYRLNATAAWVWKGLEDCLTVREIVESLVQEFAVERAVAEEETARTLREFRSLGLVA
jgi:hypothetical protein